ncbi:MAG TPA: hypothetical protein VM848_14855 [Acidimicrobiia bacterium]|nr:hypothetical protein [Acidimicrobiia bacterium]
MTVDKPSRFNDRFKLRIIGFGKLRDQEKFFAEVRNAALKERRALKNWIL